MVLFNPLYFTFLLVALVSSSVFHRYLCTLVECSRTYFRYLIIQLGLAGPLYQITKTVSGEVSNSTYHLQPFPYAKALSGPTASKYPSKRAFLAAHSYTACARGIHQ